MLGNIICWVIALALILSKTSGSTDLHTRLLFAMGFIFLGTLSKAVDYYGTQKSAGANDKNNSNPAA